MQFQILATAALLCGLASAQSTITATAAPNASQASKINSDLSSYLSGLTTASAWSSYSSAGEQFLATATDTAVLAGMGAITADANNWNQAVSAFNSPLPTQIPSDLASYYNSVRGAAASIINKDMSNAAAGGMDRSVVVSGVVLAGAAAIALAL